MYMSTVFDVLSRFRLSKGFPVVAKRTAKDARGNGSTFPRVAGGGWRVAGDGWRVAVGGFKIYMKIKYYNEILLLIMI